MLSSVVLQKSISVLNVEHHGADIVKLILSVRPNFAGKVNKNGMFPLHYASSRGNLEITKLLLGLDSDLAREYNNGGYTPLHLAAINGNVKILEAFIESAPTSFSCLTNEGETVFHLTVRFDKQTAFMCLAESSQFTNLLDQQDGVGNTILHLAVLRKNEHVRFLYSSLSLHLNMFYELGRIDLTINLLSHSFGTGRFNIYYVKL